MLGNPRRMPKGRADRAARGGGKTTNLINHCPTPAQAPIQEGQSRCRGFWAAAFSVLRIPAPRCAFPAWGEEKFSAYPLREFCRKNLQSKASSTRILQQKAEPLKSLCAETFLSLYRASKSRSAAASSTDPIGARTPGLAPSLCRRPAPDEGYLVKSRGRAPGSQIRNRSFGIHHTSSGRNLSIAAQSKAQCCDGRARRRARRAAAACGSKWAAGERIADDHDGRPRPAGRLDVIAIRVGRQQLFSPRGSASSSASSVTLSCTPSSRARSPPLRREGAVSAVAGSSRQSGRSSAATTALKAASAPRAVQWRVVAEIGRSPGSRLGHDRPQVDGLDASRGEPLEKEIVFGPPARGSAPSPAGRPDRRSRRSAAGRRGSGRRGGRDRPASPRSGRPCRPPAGRAGRGRRSAAPPPRRDRTSARRARRAPNRRPCRASAWSVPCARGSAPAAGRNGP